MAIWISSYFNLQSSIFNFLWPPTSGPVKFAFSILHFSLCISLHHSSPTYLGPVTTARRFFCESRSLF